MSTAAPRTLADQLRESSDEQLGALLRARPDLATPAPHDSAHLASRAVVRGSVLRALDQLDLPTLSVLQAMAQGDDPSVVVHLSRTGSVTAALTRLAEVGLVWGTPAKPVSTLVDLLRVPEGPEAATVPGELAVLSPQAKAVLDRLARANADGRLESGRGKAGRPVQELLDAGLLIARDAQHVTIPWRVRLVLHRGRSTAEPVDVAPEIAVAERDQTLLDRTAAGAAYELCRRVELLLDRWGVAPPAALKAGGLGVRDLKAAATLLQVETDTAALVVETAAAAGLIGQGMTDDLAAAWLPTDRFDGWQALSPAQRWLTLARVWLNNPRLIALVGGRAEERGTSKPVNALAPDLERPWLPDLRADVLDALASTEPGQVLAAGTGTSSIAERLRWHRPRRPEYRLEQLDSVLAESALFGILGLGGLSTFGRAFLGAPDSEESAHLLAALLPEPVDHILIQADLTAIAPGPLTSELAREVALLADVESRGGATVFRFTAPTIRRAFDAGWSANEVHDFVSSASRTPVPQSLTYLIDDVSRRFGTIRAGHAESFLRSDDETALTELVNRPDAAELRLRRIAPTVVISDVPLGVLLPRLRDLGVAPVVEAPDGTVRVARPEVFRARSPHRRQPSTDGGRAVARTGARVSAVVSAIRAGDRARASRSTRDAASSPVEVVAMLRRAAETSAPVLIGYVGNDGTVGERLVVPERVEGGQLTAYDERAELSRSFAIHRITAAQVSESAPR